MKNHLLTINANNEPATLEQLLRVVRFRGFKVSKIVMSLLPSDQSLDIRVSVKSSRPIRLLENQLMKLVDINQVLVEQEQSVRVRN